MSVDSVPKDTVSTLTLFLPALLFISPLKSAFTLPHLSNMGKTKEGVKVCSWAVVLRQAAQVNWEKRGKWRIKKCKRWDEKVCLFQMNLAKRWLRFPWKSCMAHQQVQRVSWRQHTGLVNWNMWSLSPLASATQSICCCLQCYWLFWLLFGTSLSEIKT